jgi:hypothetical protein
VAVALLHETDIVGPEFLHPCAAVRTEDADAGASAHVELLETNFGIPKTLTDQLPKRETGIVGKKA